MRTTTTIDAKLDVDTLLAMGGCHSTFNGSNHVVFRDWKPFAGLRYDKGPHGYPADATINGHPISTMRAMRLNDAIIWVYFDIDTGTLNVLHYDATWYDPRYFDGRASTLELVQAITSGIKLAAANV